MRKQPFNEWYFTAAVFVIAAAVPVLLSKRTPAEILDERLARGEIGVEGCHRLRDVLQGASR